MLSELNIKNFALINTLSINFELGFNVLTGETGAGKSIILDALDILMGARAYKEVIKSNRKSAYIEALFYPNKKEDIKEILVKNGIEFNDGMLVISREINQDGGNKGRINNQLVRISLIQEIAPYLIDIHGQHEQQGLLDENTHLSILDQYIKDDINDLKEKIANLFKKIAQIKTKLSRMETDDKDRARKIDLYKFQIDEIDDANLKIDEDKELLKKYKKLSNLEEIFSLSGQIGDLISGDSFKEEGFIDKIGHYMKQIEKFTEYDNKLKEFSTALQNIYYELEELNFGLDNYLSKNEFDQNELQVVQDRLDQINKLKRKYGETIEEILKYRDQLAVKLDELSNQEEYIKELNSKLKDILNKFDKYAQELSMIRKKEAKNLTKEVENQLKDLAMDKARLKVNFNEVKPSETGIDQINFLISTNPGEDLKPLTKIISGGELSRIMLAFKNIIADLDQVETLVFDEVDKGIGGKTAQKMAEKLFRISQKRQIICVSHLPQVASMGDYHYYIKKTITNNKETVTDVKRLNKKEKIEELTRMLGGAKLTEITTEHAKEILDLAKEKKKTI
ncbi:MAG: DNA repair protein RecN [Halanaerobiales bacterium]|nr:DNA repair protein RecN [Halanaerobiales bacterium]